MPKGIYKRTEEHKAAIKIGQRKRLVNLVGQEKLGGYTLAGYAILRKDPGTDLKYWATYDHTGGDFASLSPMQPLIFSVEKLEEGTRVELHVLETNG